MQFSLGQHAVSLGQQSAVFPPRGSPRRGVITVSTTTIMVHITPHPSPDRVRVLAADSTSMSTQLLVEALARDSQFDMIESAPNGLAVLHLLKQEKPHIAVVSSKLCPDHLGYDLVREIRSQEPATRVIVLLDTSESSSVVEAFRAGAQGVFCRTEPFRLLSKCIQCVHQGQIWASSSELEYVLEALARPTFAKYQTKSGSLLSARETDVVRCLVEGLTNREVAQRLKLTEHTVKNYLFRIFEKLGVSSRVEVVLYALGQRATHPSVPSNGRRSQTGAASPRSAVPISISGRKTGT
jgi:DNA-binding NarL/FixJ family response regulator